MVSCLFYARLVWVEEGSSLHVLRDKLGAHARDLVPVVQHGQGEVLLVHWKGQALE